MIPTIATIPVKPKKNLGQVFLTDERIMARIIDHADLTQDDTVLEVGAGTGALTVKIADKAGKVIAVEKDPELTKILRIGMRDNPHVTILHGDFFKLDIPPFDKVVSNIPYYISTKLLLWLSKQKFTFAVILLQKEYVDKLYASPRSKKYGRISILLNHRLMITRVENVPRTAFYPIPKVDSTLVSLSLNPHLPKLNEDFFEKLVTRLFSYRRKMLRNALKNIGWAPFNSSTGIAGINDKRVHDLTLKDFETLAEVISNEKL